MFISRFPNNEADTRISELEKLYSVSLPSSYRSFLAKYNGGDTPETKFSSGRNSTVLRGFYGFGNVRYSFKSFENMAEWIATGYFPIACDAFGNYISISLADGGIYFVDHELDFSMGHIADDFETFIKKCKSKKLSPDVKMSIEEREADLISRGKGGNITDGLRKMWQDEIDTYGSMVQERAIIK